MSTTFYVDGANGKDTNSGEAEGAAWKSLKRVNEGKSGKGYEEGDRILFKGGAEHSPEVTSGLGALLKPPSNGKSGAPIIFGSYGSGKGVLKTSEGHYHVELEGKNWLVFENLVLETEELNKSTEYNAKAGGFGTPTGGAATTHITIKNCEAFWCGLFIYLSRPPKPQTSTGLLNTT